MNDQRANDITRAVIAITRTVGHGNEPIQVDFAQSVLKKAKYPHSWYLAVACRLIAEFADGIEGQTFDQVLQDILDQTIGGE